MRWESLFADLDAQAAALDRGEVYADAEDVARAEFANVSLADRLRGALGANLLIQVLGGAPFRGVLRGAGPDWLLLDTGDGREALIPLAAVLGVTGLGRHAVPAEAAGPVTARLGLRLALRAVARDRSVVRVGLVDGTRLSGLLGRVGADFMEVSRTDAGIESGGRAATGGGGAIVCLPYAALAAVQRQREA